MENNNWENHRKKIIGLGETSGRKSYYPELKQKISELEQINNNLSTLFENTNDAIVIHTDKGEIIKLNERAKSLFNADKNDFSFRSILKDDVFENLKTVWSKVILGESKIIDIELDNNEGSFGFMEVSLRKTKWYSQEVIISAIRDITKRKQYEKELKVAKLKAEESEELKTAFLANMSHEIRTPLNGILGFTELLVDPSFDDAQKQEMAEIIQNSGDLLLAIISDIIDISKIESNQLVLKFFDFEIEKLFVDLQKTFEMKAEKEGLRLAYSNLSFINHTVNSDYNRLKQIFTNLIGNAIKFTETGEITFGTLKQKDQLVFYVCDTGIGIPKEKHQVIFERFNRRDAYTKTIDGSGLGLAIAKNLVELLGGKIWVESTPGVGSCFYFTIKQ